MAGHGYRIGEVDELHIWQVAIALGNDKPAAPVRAPHQQLDDTQAAIVRQMIADQQARIALSEQGAAAS